MLKGKGILSDFQLELWVVPYFIQSDIAFMGCASHSGRTPIPDHLHPSREPRH